MELIEQIGSYAGFAAVIGLAILSALYFSQARDVRRLREWAGRAPERDLAPRAAPAARPAPRTAAAAVPARTATAAVPAEAQAAGAQAAGAQPAQAATPAGAQAATPAATPAAAAAGTQAPAEPGEAEPAAGEPAEAGAEAPAAADAPDASGGAPAAAPPVPGRPAGANGASAASPLPPSRVLPRPPVSRPRVPAPPPPPPPWYRRVQWPAPRYLALIVAGVVVLGAGAAYALGVLDSGEEPQGTAGSAEQEQQPERQGGEAPLDPADVTVSVLNGTTVTGLARQISDDLEQRGFQIGNVTNAAGQNAERAESVALYAPGARREARAVARAAGISQIEAADAEAQQLGGGATVIVVVGLDKTGR